MINHVWSVGLPTSAALSLLALLVGVALHRVRQFDAAHAVGTLSPRTLLDPAPVAVMRLREFEPVEHHEVDEETGLDGYVAEESSIPQTVDEWLRDWDRQATKDARRAHLTRLFRGEDVTVAESHLGALDEQLSIFRATMEYLGVQDVIDRWIAEDTEDGYRTRLAEVREAYASSPVDSPTGELPLYERPDHQRRAAFAILGA